MDIFEKIVSGAAAGVLSRTAVAPVERVIIVKQTQVEIYKGMNSLRTLSEMVKHEGKSSLFKGNWANCVRIAPFQAIEFFMFDVYKKFFAARLQINRVFLDLLAGGLAGMTASALVYPLDLAKTHMAINLQKGKTPGIFETLSKIVKNEGWRALFKGLKATMLGMAPYASLKLTFYNNLQYYYSRYLNVDQKQMSLSHNLLLGGLSGCLAVTITYPTDLVRRNLQVLKLKSNQPVTYSEVIQKIYQKNGFKGLYTGLPATYLKLMPSVAIAFGFNDLIKQTFSRIKLEKQFY